MTTPLSFPEYKLPGAHRAVRPDRVIARERRLRGDCRKSSKLSAPIHLHDHGSGIRWISPPRILWNTCRRSRVDSSRSTARGIQAADGARFLRNRGGRDHGVGADGDPLSRRRERRRGVPPLPATPRRSRGITAVTRALAATPACWLAESLEEFEDLVGLSRLCATGRSRAGLEPCRTPVRNGGHLRTTSGPSSAGHSRRRQNAALGAVLERAGLSGIVTDPKSARASPRFSTMPVTKLQFVAVLVGPASR